MAFGIVGLALEWINRFLVDRTQQMLNLDRMNFGDQSLGYPLLVLLYTVELFEIFLKKSWTAGGSSIPYSVPAGKDVSAVEQFTQ